MTKYLTILAAAVLPAMPAPGLAQGDGGLQHVYREQLEGVYFQDWHAQVLGSRDGTAIEVYVVGDGKSGDFFGVISVDCQTPAYSRWLATGGFVQASDIPAEAVQGIRGLVC